MTQQLSLRRFFFGMLCALGLILQAAISQAAPYVMVPGALWRDTQGNVIQAHGGGMLQVGKTFYWFGENRALAVPGQPLAAVKCYASSDLAHWTFKSDALVRQNAGDLGPGRVVERPKVLYNALTHLYVMYVHNDSANYGEAKVGVATSPTVDGTYTFRSSFQPLNHQSRDMTLFQDRDGAGYLIFEDRKRGLGIARLAPDYMSVDREVALIPHAIEAPAMIHVGDTYYLLGSHLSGWDANSNVWFTAPSVAGPWSEPADVAPPGTLTFDSQTAFILPVTGSQATSYIYGGDRWQHGQNLAYARYVWLPLNVENKSLRLESSQPWSIDAATGVITPRPFPPVQAGDYRLVNRRSGLALAAAADASKDGAAIVAVPMGTPGGDAVGQVWHVAPVGDGYYSILNAHSGKSLDVTGRSVQDAAPVAQWTANGGNNQLWRLAPADNGYFTITAKHSDQQLAVAGDAGPNAAVTQRVDAAAAEQEWKLMSVDAKP